MDLVKITQLNNGASLNPGLPQIQSLSFEPDATVPLENVEAMFLFQLGFVVYSTATFLIDMDQERGKGSAG